MEKARLPVTICTVCGRVGYSIQLANGTCGWRLPNGKLCRGVNGSAEQESDWLECPHCDGTGWKGTKCEPCDGAGWMFVRDKPWLKKEIEEERQKRKQ